VTLGHGNVGEAMHCSPGRLVQSTTAGVKISGRVSFIVGQKRWCGCTPTDSNDLQRPEIGLSRQVTGVGLNKTAFMQYIQKKHKKNCTGRQLLKWLPLVAQWDRRFCEWNQLAGLVASRSSRIITCFRGSACLSGSPWRLSTKWYPPGS
jgi:hypothetical protein